jgi:hypothetical protein
MRRFHPGWITTIVAMSVVILSVFAYGQTKLAEVPSNLPDTQRDALTKQRAALLADRSTLTTRMDILNKKRVPKNSPEYQELLRKAEQLSLEMQKHESESRKFNRKIDFFLHYATHLTLKNLSEDSDLQKRVKLRLDEIERRINGLNKAISLLDDVANPKWQEALDSLTEDMRENLDELLWVSLDMITLDLMEAVKFTKGGLPPSIEEKLKNPVWQKLYKRKDDLAKLLKRVTGMEAAAVENALKTVTEIENAKTWPEVIKGMEKARDLVARSKEIREEMEKAAKSSQIYDTLFNVSVITGQVGLSLIEGTCKPVAVAGHYVTRAIEGALLVKLIEEGEQQLIEMDLQAATRQQKKGELLHKVSRLQEEQVFIREVFQTEGQE